MNNENLLIPSLDIVKQYNAMWSPNDYEKDNVEIKFALNGEEEFFTKDALKEYNIDFDEIRTGEELLNNTFDKLKEENVQLKDVQSAVILLDSIYHTQLSRLSAIFAISENIYNMIKKENLIEEIMNPEDPKDTKKLEETVEKIARAGKGNNRYNYSFATKFCNRLNPKSFPIYDQYVDELLWKYYKAEDNCFNEKFYRKDLKNYSDFFKTYKTFKECFCLDELNYKQIDEFMWTYGKIYRKINEDKQSA